MASVKYGAIVTQLSGKLGGHAFGNGYGGPAMWPTQPGGSCYINQFSWAGNAYWCKKVKGVPHSAGHYRSLSPEQKAAWESIASSYPQTNRVGHVYTPSGFQVFMSVNALRQSAGLSIQEAPEPPFTYPELAAPVINLSEIAFTCTTPVSGDEDILLQLFATACISKGANRSRGGFKLLGFLPTQTESPQNISTLYYNIFGDKISGTSILFKWRYIHRKTPGKKLWGYIKKNYDV